METAEVEIEESGDVYALCPYHQYDFSLTSEPVRFSAIASLLKCP